VCLILTVIFKINEFDKPTFCEVGTILSAWASAIFIIPLQIIIVARTIALWERNKYVMVLLITTVVATDVAIFSDTILLSIEFFRDKYQSGPSLVSETASSCYNREVQILHRIGSTSAQSWPTAIALLALDTLIFLLTIFRGFRTFRSLRTPLITVLIRDGSVYYAVILGICAAHFVLLTMDDSRIPLKGMIPPALWASCSIIGSRLMLNMRGVLKETSARGYTTGAGPSVILTMNFASNQPLQSQTV